MAFGAQMESGSGELIYDFNYVRYSILFLMRFTILILLITIVSNVFGQILKKYNLPGFIQINDTLFVSKYEVSIRDYSHFLFYTKEVKKDSTLAEQSLPDPNAIDWSTWDSYTKSLVIYTNPVYEFNDTSVSFTSSTGSLPVVNISRTQAMVYCNFKTSDYQIFLQKAKPKQKKNLPQNLVFRLLTQSEWTKAAASISDTDNIICSEFFEKHSLKERRPMTVFEGEKNNYGLFNMVGNVAELVSDNDDAFGGSFKDSMKECTSISQRKPDQSIHAVGFRIAAVIR